MSGHPEIRQYLKPEKVCQLHNNSNPISITCYFNGFYWICPNPLDERRSMSIRDQYDMGQYIERKVYQITQADFNDGQNWNI